MTGEVTSRAGSCPSAGQQKVLAAHRAGLKEIILPERNGADLEDVPESVRSEMTFHLASEIDQVLVHALAPEGLEAAGVPTCTPDPGTSRRRRGDRGSPLLQVTLDRALGADVGVVGILAGVAAGAALAEEVLALVELDPDLVEAGLLLLVETFAGGLAFEGVLLLDQGADAVEDLLVVHGLLRVDLGWLPVMMPGGPRHCIC